MAGRGQRKHLVERLRRAVRHPHFAICGEAADAIVEARNSCARFEGAIEEALFVLSGADTLDRAEILAPTHNPTLVDLTTDRNQRARNILATALKPTPSQEADDA